MRNATSYSVCSESCVRLFSVTGALYIIIKLLTVDAEVLLQRMNRTFVSVRARELTKPDRTLD